MKRYINYWKAIEKGTSVLFSQECNLLSSIDDAIDDFRNGKSPSWQYSHTLVSDLESHTCYLMDIVSVIDRRAEEDLKRKEEEKTNITIYGSYEDQVRSQYYGTR